MADSSEVNDLADELLGYPTEAAIAADAAKLLRRAGVFEPSPAQVAAARESARIEYNARAAHALKTGVVIS